MLPVGAAVVDGVALYLHLLPPAAVARDALLAGWALYLTREP